MVAQGVVTSRLNYCNGLLHGTSARNMERLQVAQNSLVRAVCQATWSSSVTELRRSPHWLPVKQRVDYEVAVIIYNTRLTGVPSYLSMLIKDYEPGGSLRSSDRLLLRPPRAKLVCSRTVLVWNSLSFNIVRLSHSLLLNVFWRLIYLLLHTHRLPSDRYPTPLTHLWPRARQYIFIGLFIITAEQ